MSKFAITGGARGIGLALRDLLISEGHDVLTIDLSEGDVSADLSNSIGRKKAIDAIKKWAPEGLKGYIPCAGLPPVATPIEKIPSVNFFSAIETVESLQALLSMDAGSALLVASNSAPMLPHDHPFVVGCLAGDEEKSIAQIKSIGDGHIAYVGSKRALAMWMRRNVVYYAKLGIRLNAIAPGITQTDLTKQVYDDPKLGQAMKDFEKSVPSGGSTTPDKIASAMNFMLGESARFIYGAVFFVDGGSDAMLRPEHF